jgi:hypothetical protein
MVDLPVIYIWYLVYLAVKPSGPGDGAGATGLEPAASGVTGRRSNQLNYAPAWDAPFGAWLSLAEAPGLF